MKAKLLRNSSTKIFLPRLDDIRSTRIFGYSEQGSDEEVDPLGLRPCSPHSTLSGIKCDLCDTDCYLDCALARKNLHNSDDSALSLATGDSAQLLKWERKPIWEIPALLECCNSLDTCGGWQIPWGWSWGGGVRVSPWQGGEFRSKRLCGIQVSPNHLPVIEYTITQCVVFPWCEESVQPSGQHN